MRLPRFRLRTLMIAVAVVAVLGWLAIELSPLWWGPAYDAWVDTGDQYAYWRGLLGW